MNISITIGFTPEAQAVLENLLKGLAGKTKSTPAKKEETPNPESNGKVVQIAENTVTGTDITVEQIRAAVRDKSQAGKRDEIKKLLTEFHVDKVTSLDKEQYPLFLEKVNSL